MLKGRGKGPAMVYCDKNTNLIYKSIHAMRRKKDFHSVAEVAHTKIADSFYKSDEKGFEQGQPCPESGVAVKIDYIFE